MTHRHKHPHLTHPKYRPDIDGLRAIAILAVVIFHAFPGKISGGFIGVDIFFVISGFLISTIIFSSLERDRFSLVEFYLRRVRRIFPALILVLISSMAFGWYVLFADEYKQLGKHTAAGAGFIQNFILWRESGYFDNLAETKPLLHLWSLAIEEQFYIFWPLLLTLVWWRQWSFLRITAFIAAFSFAANIYLIMRGHITAAFYLPLSRFWELMVGGVLAHVVLHRPQLIDKHKDAQSFAGFALILTGLFLLDKGKDFPGFWALMPTLGTFLIISAGPDSWLNQNLFANKLMVWIGLISYPLYLWHWPILAFIRIVFVEPPEHIKAAALVAAVLLAYLTYSLVEKPLRLKPRRSVTMIIAGLLILTGTLGAVLYKVDAFNKPRLNKAGINLIYDRTKLGFLDCGDEALKSAGLDYCSKIDGSNKIDSIIVGDSHADDKYLGLSTFDKNRSWMLIGNNSCPPVIGINVVTTVKDCQPKFEEIFNWIDKHPEIKTVALGYFGNYFLTTSYAADNKFNKRGPGEIKLSSPQQLSRYETFRLGLDNSIDRLIKAEKQVILLIDIPELPYFPKDCERRNVSCTVSINEVIRRQSQHRQMVQELQSKYPSILVFDPVPLLCNSQTCTYKIGDVVMYRDSHHLSINGSKLYGTVFIEWLDNQQYPPKN